MHIISYFSLKEQKETLMAETHREFRTHLQSMVMVETILEKTNQFWEKLGAANRFFLSENGQDYLWRNIQEIKKFRVL